MGFILGILIFVFGRNKGFECENGLFSNAFVNAFTLQFNENFGIFSDLCNGTLLVPITRPTHYPAPNPTPNPRDFDLFGSGKEVFDIEYDYLNDVFVFEFYGNFCIYNGA